MNSQVEDFHKKEKSDNRTLDRSMNKFEDHKGQKNAGNLRRSFAFS
jgi:hypothetical protein